MAVCIANSGPLRSSRLHRLAEQLQPPQVSKKPAYAFPQRISADRGGWSHQTDQQSELHIAVTVHDGLERSNQPVISRKLRAKLSQLTTKLLDTHAAPATPVGCRLVRITRALLLRRYCFTVVDCGHFCPWICRLGAERICRRSRSLWTRN